ncbi:MAG: putative iron-sulfur cluster assembly protein [Tardiphaga sp.]|nr:putative iron-sulfur cluster assembly protein [Tardiphaga sp.]
MNFTITPKAEKFIRMAIRADGDGNSGFRLAVSPGGCSGLAADISVLRQPAAGDAIVERNGVKLFLPAESRLLLEGVTIDFADTAAQTGLVFHDPKQASCASHAAPVVIKAIG